MARAARQQKKATPRAKSPSPASPVPTEFRDAAAFRTWLARHHARAAELLVLLPRKGTQVGGLTYADALDEALCFGWIDGVRRSAGAAGYTLRFTPRRTGSIWSQLNIRHVERLTREGRMQPPGLAAFAARRSDRVGVYSFENRPETLPAPLAAEFRRDAAAWTYFETQPPGYRRTVTWWVVSAKRPETQRRRLAHVIAESRASRRIDFMAPFKSGGA